MSSNGDTEIERRTLLDETARRVADLLSDAPDAEQVAAVRFLLSFMSTWYLRRAVDSVILEMKDAR
jgi:hypothetical protein